MKRFYSILCVCFALVATCACHEKGPEPEPEPVFTLDSYNGHLAQAISDAYDVFEETGALPTSVNVEGITYNKGRYFIAACLLLERIVTSPETWQEGEIDLFSAAFGDEYRWNTYDPDVIDFAHIRYMASRMVNYARDNGSLPNYVTFPSDDPQNPGYMPQLTMVVTKHDNRMNLRTAMVVMARVIHYFVNNKGTWPEEVSAWPASYLDATRNCPKDNDLVKTTLAAALANLPATATDRQKAEAIFTYARDEWEWENYMNTSKGALGTINAKGGNCCDLTHATLALCRAAGIPARYLHGQCYFTSGVIGHVIPEIYVDGKWWVCDPSNNSATFGTPTWKGMETFNGRYNELEF